MRLVLRAAVWPPGRREVGRTREQEDAGPRPGLWALSQARAQVRAVAIWEATWLLVLPVSQGTGTHGSETRARETPPAAWPAERAPVRWHCRGSVPAGAAVRVTCEGHTCGRRHGGSEGLFLSASPLVSQQGWHPSALPRGVPGHPFPLLAG